MNAVLGRTNIGWYTFLVCFPLSWYYLSRTILPPFPYHEGLSALLSAGTFLPLMVAAIAAAWEGGRQSSATLGIPTSVRSPFVIAALGALPAFAVVAASHLAATVVVLASNDVTPPFPKLSLYGGFLGLLFGISITSWFAGYFLSNVIGAPLMAVMVYVLAILPSLIGHEEYRAVFADRSGCCAIDQQVDWHSVVTPFFIAVGIIFIAIAIASWLWIRKGLYPIVGIAGTVALVIGLVLPGKMNDPWAVVARSEDELICETSTATDIEYCVWPEQESQLEELLAIGDRSLTTWHNQTLIPAPYEVTLGEITQRQPGQLSIDLPPDATDGEVALTLAFGVLPDPSRCQGGSNIFTYYSMVVWLAIDGGASASDPVFDQFKGLGRTSLLDEVVSKLDMPFEEQLDWFQWSEPLKANHLQSQLF